ncbi:MAG TPA: Fic family protein [Anaeromyxobacteraceae bacterium]|nr:Fic family protein [Anaeromyxobacteraceae bacterium]
MRTRYVDIDDRHQDLAERMRAEPAAAEDFLRKWELSWLYHENAMEGIVYSETELHAALANQPVADAAFLRALVEIRNHKAALDFVRAEAAQKKAKINLTTVKKLYEMLGAGIDGRSVAEYRNEMPLHRAYYHEIAQPARIPALLAKLCDQAESAELRNAHPIQRATKIHHAFMQIFPYTENSGRVARLLVNLILLGAGYLPVIVHSTDRQRYYDSFRLPEANLRDLTMEAIENGLAHAEKFFASVQPSSSRKVGR